METGTRLCLLPVDPSRPATPEKKGNSALGPDEKVNPNCCLPSRVSFLLDSHLILIPPRHACIAMRGLSQLLILAGGLTSSLLVDGSVLRQATRDEAVANAVRK